MNLYHEVALRFNNIADPCFKPTT